MREIKFRALFFPENEWVYFTLEDISKLGNIIINYKYWRQYTGLKDKNGLTEVYEGDIIDIDGNIIGNLYQNNELLKETTNITVQDFGGKTWCATYKEALERGCKNS